MILVPIALPVGVDEARRRLRLDGAHEDHDIAGMIAAATARAEKETGRAFSPQWDMLLNDFPEGEITTPYCPLSQVEITYRDEGGAQQTVPAEDYEIDFGAGSITPNDGWPVATAGPGAVRVRFSLATICPPDVTQAILLLVGHYYRDREDSTEIPKRASSLLELHKRMFV